MTSRSNRPRSHVAPVVGRGNVGDVVDWTTLPASRARKPASGAIVRCKKCGRRGKLTRFPREGRPDLLSVAHRGEYIGLGMTAVRDKCAYPDD